MATFTLTIETDNAAFGDDIAGELARILRKLADDLDGLLDSELGGTSIRDVNGNTVGRYDFDDDGDL